MGENDKAAVRREKREHLLLPRYTLSEEIVNAVTHGLGAALAAAALVVLLVLSPKNALTMVSVSIYGGTLFLLYTISTLYHALGLNRAKKLFRVLDHCTIYLLIAGSYTPICLLVMGGPGVLLCALVWAVAAAGVLLNAINLHKFRVVSMIFYIALGWCIVLFIGPLASHIDSLSITLLIIGGVLYTVGAVLYGKCKRVPYMHGVWHLLCLGGSLLHFVVVYRIAVLGLIH